MVFAPSAGNTAKKGYQGSVVLCSVVLWCGKGRGVLFIYEETEFEGGKKGDVEYECSTELESFSPFLSFRCVRT